MEYVEHRVQAVGHCEVLVMGPDAVLYMAVDVYVADVDLALMLIDVVDLFLIIDYSPFVDLDVSFLLVGICYSDLVDVFASFAEHESNIVFAGVSLHQVLERVDILLVTHAELII